MHLRLQGRNQKEGRLKTPRPAAPAVTRRKMHGLEIWQRLHDPQRECLRMRPTSMRVSYLLAHAERAVAQMCDKEECITDSSHNLRGNLSPHRKGSQLKPQKKDICVLHCGSFRVVDSCHKLETLLALTGTLLFF